MTNIKNPKKDDLVTKELTLLERISLPSVLPKEATYNELVINRDINLKVNPTQSEILKYKIESVALGSNSVGLKWDEAGTKVKFKIEFTKLELNAIILGLKKLDNEKKLTSDLVTLYEKFCVNN